MHAVRAAAGCCVVGAAAVGVSLIAVPPVGPATNASPVTGPALETLGWAYLVIAAGGPAATLVVRPRCLRWSLVGAAAVWGTYATTIAVGAFDAGTSWVLSVALALVAVLHVYLAYEAARHCQ